MDEITAKVTKDEYFIKLYANKAFWQVVLSEDSRELTTFNTLFGRDYYNRLPYGICSSPEVCYQVFNQIFEGIENVGIFADEMLLRAETKEQILRITGKVFERATVSVIGFDASKIAFMFNKVKCLGPTLSGEGTEVDKDKVESIEKMQVPRKKKLLTFLGIANHVSKLVPNAAQVTNILRQLIKKDVPFV